MLRGRLGEPHKHCKLRIGGISAKIWEMRFKTILFVSQLDPFYDYLTTRWNEGCANAHRLFLELREKGYRGGETTVRSFVSCLRKELPGMARPPKQAQQGKAGVVPISSPRERRWLLTRQ